MPRVNKNKITFKQHKANWEGCIGCYLCKDRKNVVLLRGTVPCQVLFVGEAPGKSENILGRPFVGPAGGVLDDIIATSMIEPGSYALTNLIGCIPLTGEGYSLRKVEEPPAEAIEACAPRLLEAIELCRPQLLIAVGDVSKRWLPKLLAKTKHKNLPITAIIHPAAILRMNISQKGLALQRAAIAIADAVNDL